jgi:hypothetical protein
VAGSVGKFIVDVAAIKRAVFVGSAVVDGAEATMVVGGRIVDSALGSTTAIGVPSPAA